MGPSAMVVESDSVGSSPMVTEVGRYAQTWPAGWTAESASLSATRKRGRPDGQLSQHL